MRQSNMEFIRKAGLVVFITGMVVFLASFFLAKYSYTPEIVDIHVHEAEQNMLLKKELEPNEGRINNSNISYVKMISDAIAKVNKIQLEKYTINNIDINNIINRSKDLKFSLSLADSVFAGNSLEVVFKRESFTAYGGWLDDREFDSQASMKEVLSGIAANISRYEISGKKGFDSYRTKDLKYALTKAASVGPVRDHPLLFIFLTFGLCIIGAVIYLLPGVKELPGIKNDHIFNNPMTSRGWLGILTGSFLIIFYILLYYQPEYMTNWIIMVDPLSIALKGSEAGRFFLYGFIYTLAILVMGFRMMIKYRGNTYQQIRTVSVMFFQTAFAFLIPEILLRLNKPYFDFKNIWPLDYDFFFDNSLNQLLAGGTLGIFMLGWGISLIIIGVPVMVYFFGKRWYCSWVCGCGGLAETLGDPYRQLSDKSLHAWKIERVVVNSVLVLAVVMTAGVLYTYWTGSSQIAGLNTYSVREAYGFWIGAAFAGVVGTGFYPLMGNRVWCRFGCPLAAYLGIVQRFKSRFRITTNGGQCMSCGNCSTYCEMGIDVRWYAQRGQNIIRSSCVGCGICSAVCPRGVLKLETGTEKGRFGKPVLLGNDSFRDSS